MPSSKFVVTSKVGESFRINKVKGMFDCQFNEIKKEFDVNIPIENMKWNVGLIVGASGTGKTTIAKKVFDDFDLFQGFDWKSDSVLDDFDESFSAKQITEILSKVGFASPPDWLKPFNVLSNGQKMRVELARLILESDKPFIYDEFTSVVDRQVACVGSSAIQKFVRKEDKQFIAVSCHYDIKEWLEPDWIYDVNKMEFTDTRGVLRRPKIEVNIRKAQQSEWKLFKDFHYLSSAHNNAADKYIAEINNEIVAWCSALHFPHPKVKNMKRIHRIVVKPDYQGLGLSVRLLKAICSDYKLKGFRVRLLTGSPAFISSLRSNVNWVMVRGPSRTKTSTNNYGSLSDSRSDNRLTANFEFTGSDYE